jgi:hypothetical protein
MLEPLSMSIALCLGYSGLAGYARTTSAISPEADQVCEAATRVLKGRQGSESLFGTKALALSRLCVAIEGLVVDDDQGPVTSETYRNAESFVLALPDDLPLPEFGIDPDGAISLTWILSPTRMFSVSLSESERMAFAWLDGSDKGHAVSRFRPPSLPDAFMTILRSVVTNGSAALRVA